ncbi:methylmalonyl Co-A mutase-associated GTPase MeaB [bacterium]|nr:methylmalonyl Co-A mutase-associated GTPase MeaB [bacterium]
MHDNTNHKAIMNKIKSGNRRLLSKTMTEVENSTSVKQAIIPDLFDSTGSIKYVGIAGAFGVGKSTLIDKLVYQSRKNNLKTGVIAVDPKSPFTGGSILGDRIRMERHYLDQNVFIRSISSKNESIVPEVIIFSRLLELWGADIVFIETAGLGQTQVEISAVSNLVILALQPRSGDEIQLMKAGIMEIADVLVITKCDILEADNLENALKIELKGSKTKKDSPIFRSGLKLESCYKELFDKINTLEPTSEGKLKKNMVHWLIRRKLLDKLEKELDNDTEYQWFDPTVDPFCNAENYMKK